MSVAAQLAAVKAELGDVARACGRDPDDIRLVAVSKTHSPEIIAEALDAGHRLFGENRVQEAMEKWPPLRRDWPDLTLHMIGHLQTNKAADAVATFDVIETVDRPKLARVLAMEMAASGRRLPCFVQVNTGEEPQKGGVVPGGAEAFVASCRDEHGLDIIGLMCIPPLDDDPAPHFALLADLAGRLGLPHLSMGMSADYATAVRHGATYVRVGTAIFGPRRTNAPTG